MPSLTTKCPAQSGGWKFGLFLAIALAAVTSLLPLRASAYVDQLDYSSLVAGHGDSNVTFYLGTTTAPVTLTSIGVFLEDATSTTGSTVVRLTCVNNTFSGSQSACTDVNPIVSSTTVDVGTKGEYTFAFNSSPTLQSGVVYVMEILSSGESLNVFGQDHEQFANQCTVFFVGQTDCTGTPYLNFGSFNPLDTHTRIVDGIPKDGATIATSTAASVGATTYINTDDFTTSDLTGWSVRVVLSRNSSFFGCLTGSCASHTFSFPVDVTTIGLHDFATTTPLLTEGVYTEQIQIRHDTFFSGLPLLGGLGVVTTRTTTFTVNTAQASDIVASTSVANLLGFSTTASSTATFTDCFTFNMSLCITYLFAPQPDILQKYSDLGDTIGRKPPFGYVPLLRGLLGSASSSTSTPAFAFTGPESAFFANVLVPVDDILALATGVLLLFWLWHRFTRWEFHL